MIARAIRIEIEGARMCLHSAYEVGGVVYVRGLDPKPARSSESNTCSSVERVVRRFADPEEILHIRVPGGSSIGARRESAAIE